MAVKRNHHDVWGGFAGCMKRMKFIWFVKNNLSAVQKVSSLIGLYQGFSLIYTLEFPEIMLFSRKVKIISVFKLVNGI